ncbi:hypothetical protein C8F04DRAFT_1099478, partial [Mycena alexandri]
PVFAGVRTPPATNQAPLPPNRYTIAQQARHEREHQAAAAARALPRAADPPHGVAAAPHGGTAAAGASPPFAPPTRREAAQRVRREREQVSEICHRHKLKSNGARVQVGFPFKFSRSSMCTGSWLLYHFYPPRVFICSSYAASSAGRFLSLSSTSRIFLSVSSCNPSRVPFDEDRFSSVSSINIYISTVPHGIFHTYGTSKIVQVQLNGYGSRANFSVVSLVHPSRFFLVLEISSGSGVTGAGFSSLHHRSKLLRVWGCMG